MGGFNGCIPYHIKHERTYGNKYDQDILNSDDNDYTCINCDLYKDNITGLFMSRIRKAKFRLNHNITNTSDTEPARSLLVLTPQEIEARYENIKKALIQRKAPEFQKRFRMRERQRKKRKRYIPKYVNFTFFNHALHEQQDTWGHSNQLYTVFKCQF